MEGEAIPLQFADIPKFVHKSLIQCHYGMLDSDHFKHAKAFDLIN